MIMAWPNAVDNTIFISSIISMKKINAVDIHIRKNVCVGIELLDKNYRSTHISQKLKTYPNTVFVHLRLICCSLVICLQKFERYKRKIKREWEVKEKVKTIFRISRSFG